MNKVGGRGKREIHKYIYSAYFDGEKREKQYYTIYIQYYRSLLLSPPKNEYGKGGEKFHSRRTRRPLLTNI